MDWGNEAWWIAISQDWWAKRQKRQRKLSALIELDGNPNHPSRGGVDYLIV